MSNTFTVTHECGHYGTHKIPKDAGQKDILSAMAKMQTYPCAICARGRGMQKARRATGPADVPVPSLRDTHVPHLKLVE